MYHVGKLKQGTTEFTYDDNIFQIPEDGAHDVSTCYASISGIWSYNVYDNVFYFLPTADGTTGGSCP
jgi:hypothetical protein